jgi:hypothetical protein
MKKYWLSTLEGLAQILFFFLNAEILTQQIFFLKKKTPFFCEGK